MARPPRARSSAVLVGALLVASALLAGAPGAVRAGEAQGRVAVGPFNGRRAARLRAQVQAWVRGAGYELVSWARVVRVRGAGADAEGFRKAAEELRVTAFVTGRVQRRGSRWQATVTLRGADGAPRVGGVWQASGSRGLVYAITAGGREQVLGALQAVVSGAPAPTRVAKAVAPAAVPAAPKRAAAASSAAPEPTHAQEPVKPAVAGGTPAAARPGDDEELFQQGKQSAAVDAEERPAPKRRVARRARWPRLAPLDVGLGLQLLTRAFRYRDDLYGGMREHTLGATAAIGGALDWYPAAHFTSGLAACFGLTGSFQQALGLSPVASNGAEFPAAINGWSLGLLARYALWRVQVDARVGYGAQTFQLDPVADATREHELPGAAFRFLLLGTRGRARIWRGLSASLGVAYLAVLESGELGGDRFLPRASAGGLDLAVELAYEVLYGLEVRAGFALRRFGVSANAEPGDATIVGGVSDQYTAITAGIGYRLRRGRRR